MSTLKDIAQRAGVSVSTVSNVLNGKRKAGTETEEKILALIREMDYTPTRRAHAERSIGVLVSHLDTLYYIDLLNAVEEVINKNGYNLLLSIYKSDPVLEREELNSMLHQRIDGVMLLSHEPACSLPTSRGLPPIIHLCKAFTDNATSIYVDEYLCGKIVGELLCRKQQLPSGFIGCRYPASDKKGRIVGWQHALEAAGATVSEDAIIYTSVNSFVNGYKGTQELLSRRLGLRSIFACNDVVATGVLRALKEAGYRVPEDIAVIGCDNTELSQMCYPSLTTVDMKAHELGTRGAEMMIQIIRGEIAGHRQVVLSPCLVTREST